MIADPLPLLAGFRPWQPWPPRLAAALFLAKLRELTRGPHSGAPADLTAAIERESKIESLGAAFSRLPADTRGQCRILLTGDSLNETFVHVKFKDSPRKHLEGVIVDGARDGDGEWLLDEQFTVFTTNEGLVQVLGQECHVEVR